MNEICRNINVGGVTRRMCFASAKAYHAAVVRYGRSAYDAAQEHCKSCKSPK